MSEKNDCVTSLEQYEKLVLQYREKGHEYLERINGCLAEKSVDSIIEFIRFFGEPEMMLYYVTSLSELSYAHIIAAISADEIQEYQRPIFIFNGNSIAELIDVLKKIEFRMWEVEFEGGATAESKLYAVMQKYNVTPEAMKSIIYVAGMNKRSFYKTLICIYLEKQKIEHAIRLLRYAIDAYADEKELLGLLVQLCEKTNKPEMAEAYRKRV